MKFVISDNCARLSGNTYFCEQLISKMKVLKHPYKNRLNEKKLEICLDVATSQISPDI
jgi:hypothetical protein